MLRNLSTLKKATSGLAGAVAIAGGTSAYAQIISVATPADFVIPAGTATTSVNWDVNGDGITDFTFRYRYPNTAAGGATDGVIWQANMNPFAGSAATNGTISYAGGGAIRYVSALTLGTSVGTGGAFSTAANTQIILGSRYNYNSAAAYYRGVCQ